MKFTTGQIVLRTGGDYSSYGVSGIFRALRDFDTDEAAAERKRELGRKQKPYYDAWLIHRGYWEPIDYTEWHDSDY